MLIRGPRVIGPVAGRDQVDGRHQQLRAVGRQQRPDLGQTGADRPQPHPPIRQRGGDLLLDAAVITFED
ncbi:MAG: hypothetical protein ABI301_04980, partial [Jatrophihabitantaceae bacterium]